jgi:DNA-binding transcriptional ArsR family regulator
MAMGTDQSCAGKLKLAFRRPRRNARGTKPDKKQGGGPFPPSCFRDAAGRRKYCLRNYFFAVIVNQMVKHSSKRLNSIFAALADPTRRQILAHLARGDERVTRLARPHAMSLPAISKHLRVLEKAGLLRRRRYGRVHEMRLDAKPLQQAAQWVEQYRKFWEGSLDRLAEYLEKTGDAARKEKP